MDESFVKKPWYKTVGGIAFLSVLSIILFAILTFAGFFVYYSIQIKFGNVGQLNEQFNKTVVKTADVDIKSVMKKLTIIDKSNQLVHEYNPFVGDDKAKVTIIEFVDFECSYCREAHHVFKSVMEKYQSVVRVVFKHLPMEDAHQDALIAANAAACAKEQGKFWEYHDLLFTEQKLDSASLLEDARELGLNTDKFNLCLTDSKFQKDIDTDLMDAAQIGLKGTPTYIVNGYKIEGMLTAELWDKVILELLQKS